MICRGHVPSFGVFRVVRHGHLSADDLGKALGTRVGFLIGD